MDNQHKSRQLRERLSALEQLTVNPLYVEFQRDVQEKIKGCVSAITESPVVDIASFFAREHLIGGLSELQAISGWDKNEKEGLEEQLKQLTEDKQQ